jgi:hypothetical protein
LALRKWSAAQRRALVLAMESDARRFAAEVGEHARVAVEQPAPGELEMQGVQPRLVVVEQRDVPAERCELPHDLAADRACRSRDQHVASVDQQTRRVAQLRVLLPTEESSADVGHVHPPPVVWGFRLHIARVFGGTGRTLDVARAVCRRTPQMREVRQRPSAPVQAPVQAWVSVGQRRSVSVSVGQRCFGVADTLGRDNSNAARPRSRTSTAQTTVPAIPSDPVRGSVVAPLLNGGVVTG